MIRDENLQSNINREAAITSDLSWGKIEKYEYLTGKDVLPSKSSQVIQKA